MENVAALPDTQKCPWCRDGQYSAWADTGLHQPPIHCGYCNGTGRYAEWQKHPEHARQLADDRLTKFRTVFP